MTTQPFYVARYGVYAALGVAVISGWLSYRSGNALDVSLMRSVFVFVLFTGLGFGAEAVIATAPRRARGHGLYDFSDHAPHPDSPGEPNEDEVNQ